MCRTWELRIVPSWFSTLYVFTLVIHSVSMGSTNKYAIKYTSSNWQNLPTTVVFRLVPGGPVGLEHVTRPGVRTCCCWGFVTVQGSTRLYVVWVGLHRCSLGRSLAKLVTKNTTPCPLVLLCPPAQLQLSLPTFGSRDQRQGEVASRRG